MSNLDSIRQKFIGIFDELSSKVFGKSLDSRKIERLNLVATKFSNLICQVASITALEKCKALNDAVRTGFKLVGTDISRLEERIEKLEQSNK